MHIFVLLVFMPGSPVWLSSKFLPKLSWLHILLCWVPPAAHQICSAGHYDPPLLTVLMSNQVSAPKLINAEKENRQRHKPTCIHFNLKVALSMRWLSHALLDWVCRFVNPKARRAERVCFFTSFLCCWMSQPIGNLPLSHLGLAVW